MPARRSEIEDGFQISLLVQAHGWSELVLLLPGETHRFTISAVFSDVTAGLMTICDMLLENAAISMPFYDEPGGCVWKLTPDKTQQHQMLLEVFDIGHRGASFDERDFGAPLVRIATRRSFLLTIILSELWKHALLLREPSFQTGRLPFPFGELQQLTDRWAKSSLAPAGLRMFGQRSSHGTA
jgi:hypothetical protein